MSHQTSMFNEAEENMNTIEDYLDFLERFRLLLSKRKDLITLTLSNIFTMRIIGNKTHGDLAEIAISEFINQYMYDYKSKHVGKEMYRAKSHEEDILVVNEINELSFPISLKAYGVGPLQLSTDKNFLMFPRLEQVASEEITDDETIRKIFDSASFAEFDSVNVLPLIYDENKKLCNIMVFDFEKAKEKTSVIRKISSGRGRKHPVYRFYDENEDYICEVRYGDAAANALQRGLWTHTKNAIDYFDSMTGGWIEYSHNLVLVQLFSGALVSSEAGHKEALFKIKKDIERLQIVNPKE